MIWTVWMLIHCILCMSRIWWWGTRWQTTRVLLLIHYTAHNVIRAHIAHKYRKISRATRMWVSKFKLNCTVQKFSICTVTMSAKYNIMHIALYVLKLNILQFSHTTVEYPMYTVLCSNFQILAIFTKFQKLLSIFKNTLLKKLSNNNS